MRRIINAVGEAWYPIPFPLLKGNKKQTTIGYTLSIKGALYAFIYLSFPSLAERVLVIFLSIG